MDINHITFNQPRCYNTNCVAMSCKTIVQLTNKNHTFPLKLMSVHFLCLSLLNDVDLVNNVMFLLQLGPWLAVEIPDLISRGIVTHKEKDSGGDASK